MSSATDDETAAQDTGGRSLSDAITSAAVDGRVAVVGSGVAGAGVAYALRESSLQVTVFEREDDVGGRTVSGYRNGCVFDYGANYVKPGSDRVDRLVERLDEGDLTDIAEPVWTFDADGSIEPGDPERSDDHKWSFEDGLDTLPRRLLARSDAVVRTDAPVTAVTRSEDGQTGWYLTVAGRRTGPFDVVVLTPPGPETAELLDAAAATDDRIATVAAACRSVPYRPVCSVVVHYPFAFERPYYGLVNVDRSHALGWLSDEARKRGHVPTGQSVLVAQLSPDRSRTVRDWSANEVATDTADRIATLLEEPRLAEPDWWEVTHFDRALPDSGADDVQAAAATGLAVAGDWVAGDGRIHAALTSGLRVGDRLLASEPSG